MSTYKETASVVSQETLADGICSMWIQTGSIAKEARPGQFISVYCKDGSRMLPRPISICEIKEDQLRIVYRVVGKGTEEFASKGKNMPFEGWTLTGRVKYTICDGKVVFTMKDPDSSHVAEHACMQ